jgi:hypothetical protein
MAPSYDARWVSKPRADELRRRGVPRDTVLVGALKGFIVVEPHKSHLGDGPDLSSLEAQVELDIVWCTETRVKLRQARLLLGLENRSLPCDERSPAAVARGPIRKPPAFAETPAPWA